MELILDNLDLGVSAILISICLSAIYGIVIKLPKKLEQYIPDSLALVKSFQATLAANTEVMRRSNEMHDQGCHFEQIADSRLRQIRSQMEEMRKDSDERYGEVWDLTNKLIDNLSVIRSEMQMLPAELEKTIIKEMSVISTKMAEVNASIAQYTTQVQQLKG